MDCNKSMKQNIINVSDLNPSWNWLSNDFKDSNLAWTHFSTQTVKVSKILPKKESLARFVSAKDAIIFSKKQNSVVVSHGPRPTFYSASFSKLMSANSPHLSYAFNFTNLPTGAQHKLMAKAFQQPTKFVVFSSMERKLYSEYFGIDESKIDMLHWSVHAPSIDQLSPPIESGEYICAVGGQGRDYKILFDAMRKLRNIKFVLVATAQSIQNLAVPDNVKVHINIPSKQAHNIILHSKFMVLPLRDSQVPCGHVTIVLGMFFRKAMLVTNSCGVHDYIKDNVTGRFFNPHDVKDLSIKIEELWNSPNQIELLANSALEFANIHCNEKGVVNYFKNFLRRI